ncbi:MAG: hypothetical protein E7313_06960 [Clostridiales bacterium]|nr:hypothetical protein [Clostridiales bacterium]
MKKIKNVHLILIIVGILFNGICVFHSNLWFDEAYSVGLANKSFADIWNIGGNDVHPVLYYWILHVIYLITNGSIVCYRIFSLICVSILGVLGFTHIRKDFGEKVGILFSFFSYFLPVICVYAVEIRMYSLAAVFVTILSIYAYRIFKENSERKEKDKEKISTKNWLIFGIVSLLCIYTHYYALMAAGIINVILLIYFIKNKNKKSIIQILSFGIIQLIAYIPWIMNFAKQLKQVSKGFWIGFEFPKTIMEILSSQFIGNLENVVGFIISIPIYIYLGYKAKKVVKNNKNLNVGVISIAIYGTVILAALVVTVALRTSILYYRYLFVIIGLYIFFISYYLSKEKNKYIVYGVCGVTLILAICSNFVQTKEIYSKSNMTQITYLKENVKQDDVIVIDEPNLGTGTVVSLYFENNKKYFYNPEDWGVGEAYKAFGNEFITCTNTEFLDECNGRVWIIDSENCDNYNRLFNNEEYILIQKKLIKTTYEDYVYNLILVEKVK